MFRSDFNIFFVVDGSIRTNNRGNLCIIRLVHDAVFPGFYWVDTSINPKSIKIIPKL